MELKTLKDLVDRGSVTINSGKRVRAEAVKIVKRCKDKPKDYSMEGMFKWFFNLTEEDLKDE